MADLWQCLEDLRGVSAVAAEWQERVGVDFPTFKNTFLQRTRRTAEVFPCPRECGCSHRVHPRPDGTFVGVCQCEEDIDCDDILLTADDVVVWELNRSGLGRAVAKAFDCTLKEADLGLPGTVQVGSFAKEGLTVVLTIQESSEELRGVVAELVARHGDGLILLMPTFRFLDGNAKMLLKGVRAGFYALESHLKLLSNGEFQAQQKGSELFADMLANHADRSSGKVRPGARFSFRLAGSMCDVVFDGCPVFHIEKTLGAKYLDYLLHHPNEPIRAFDLECKIMPEKARVRNIDSIQKGIDGTAVRNLLRELEYLRGKREEAADDCDTVEIDRIDAETAAIEAEIKKRGRSVDTGERARGNVSKAITAVIKKLEKQGVNERAFAEHLAESLSLGYKCNYNGAKGVAWV